MGRVLTNAVTLAATEEATPGVLAGSPIWFLTEPNSIGKYGPSVKKVARQPISKNRQLRKPALVDLDSTVEFECDVTYDHVKRFAKGLWFSAEKGAVQFKAETGVVTALTSTAITVTAGGALPQFTLIYLRGSPNPTNNGLKVVAAASTGTSIIITGGLIAEATPATNFTAEVCGFQAASADLTINASGQLTSTALDFTTLNWQIGQFIWIGGDLSNAALSFATAADRGLVRLKSIAAHLATFDKTSATFTTDTGTGKTVQLIFGRFFKNVPTDSADYLETTYQFEMLYKNLQVPGPGDEFEYASGNFCNQIDFDLPGQNKAVMKCSFVGLTTGVPTSVRASGAATPILPAATNPYNTSSNFMRLRITNVDFTGVSSDVKSMTVSIKNNASTEKVLATLGGKYLNAGEFMIEVTANVLFTSDVVIAAIRDNRQVTMEFCVQNEDGAFCIDLPAMTIDGGDKSFPMNQTVQIAMKGTAFMDSTLGDSASVSIFPYMPAA